MALILPEQQFLIPFLFVLAVVMGALKLTNVFKGNVGVDAIIAVVLAYFAATYGPLSSALWLLLPNLTWFFIAMFLLIFMMEAFGLRRKDRKSPLSDMLVYGVLFLLLLSVGYSVTQSFPLSLPFIGGGENIILLLGLIFIVAIFWSAFNVPIAVQKGG